MLNRRVAVTGYGALTSLGENANESWQSIMDGKVGYDKLEMENKDIKARYFAFLRDNKTRYRVIPKPILRCLPAFAKNTLVVAREAIEMAFGNPELISSYYTPHQCGVIIGTGWGGVGRGL